MTNAHASITHDYVDMDTAAELLGMSRRSLTSLIKRHPYYTWGGKKKQFYPQDIAALREAVREETQCRITSIGAKAQTIGGLTLKSRAVAGFEEVLEQIEDHRRKRSQSGSRRRNGNGSSKVIPLHLHSQRP